MNSSNKLKQYINRAKEITNDCRTLFWVRIQHFESIKQRDLELGGGNILIVNGLFSTISYLGKIYVHLTDNIKANNMGDIDETDAFQKLITDCPEKLGLDKLDKEGLKNIWRSWRNKLAHMLIQKEGTAWTFAPIQGHESWAGQYESLKKQISSGSQGKSFSYDETINWWNCRVDILAAEVDKITQWLINQCDSNYSRVETTLQWIEGNGKFFKM